ncbi:hypothetical protein ACHAXS_006685 [Conticribra weissflogii]
MPTPFNTCDLSAHGRSKKHVQFSKYSSLILIPSWKNDDLWYNKEDIRGFKQDAVATLRDLREEGVIVSIVEQFANNLVNSYYTPFTDLPDKAQGLEHMICYPVFKLIYLRKINAIARVLQEHEEQKLLGVLDESRLAQTSERVTTLAKEWASAIASARSA